MMKTCLYIDEWDEQKGCASCVLREKDALLLDIRACLKKQMKISDENEHRTASFYWNTRLQITISCLLIM